MGEMRLIDANALKEKAIRVSTVKEHTYLKAVGTHEIDKAPTIDAVPVVWCGECVSGGRCYAENVFRFAGVENPYCCAGKRKDGDTDGD